MTDTTGTGMPPPWATGRAAPAFGAPWPASARRTKPIPAVATAVTANPAAVAEMRIIYLLRPLFAWGYPEAMVTGGLRSSPRCGFAFAQALDDRVEYGHERQAEDGGGQHAAEDGGADRLPAGRAGAGGEHQRNHAQDEGEGRHQDRAQSQAPGFHGSGDNIKATLAALPGELDDQDRIFRRQTYQHDQTNLGENVELHAARP